MKRKLAIATLTAAALIGTGTVSAVAFADGGDQKSAQAASVRQASADDDRKDDRDDRDDDGRDDRRDRDDRGDDVSPSGLKISAAEAAAKGAAKGTVTSVDLDDDRGNRVWEVTTTDGKGVEHDYLVDTESGKLTAEPADHDRDDDGRYDDDRHDRGDDHGGDRDDREDRDDD
ncbi:peptidase YpeB-like protein [Streptomyces sp. Amel2xB2]|uniref:PepSY domain-containing protein n=1 Tax=Streptomyces sp. Amel2xB2 TaxID=1305829 RepID=UPI000DB9BED4|nr:PepSY domain-containing protein [Streptomyces sp. Amel2xB2]RAJ63299.1 peptidase YpeB-like protein [Streptomyces sp. Amel2xB2]